MRRPPAPRTALAATVTALTAALSALSSAASLGAQDTASAAERFAPVGRWDLRVTHADGRVAPSWLEVTRSGHQMLVGRFVGEVGSARPVARVEFTGGVLRFAIPPQWEDPARVTGDLRVEGRLASGGPEGDRLSGTLVTPTGEQQTWTAVRAPALLRPAPRWGAPVRLFNGRDLAGWTTRGGENRWRVADGVLANAGGGANLLTTRTFDDFKLHLEFRYPARANSGVYLRGRYEVQVEDDEVAAAARDTRIPLSSQIGGVYGFLPPSADAALGPGRWQTYDITLVGRRVTVVLNGRTVIADQIIPGITGGALDSDEGAPGPLLLQGDHGPVEYRNVVLTPAAPRAAASR